MDQKPTEQLRIGDILSRAFHYWSRTFVYQVMFALLFLSLLISVFMYALDYYGLFDSYVKSIEAFSKGAEGAAEYAKIQQTIAANPNYSNFSWVLIITMVLLFPLHMGFYKMFRKIDDGEKVKSEDMFAGYLGVNFFIYSSYYLFWVLLLGIFSKIFIGLALLWIALTIFSAPLMFFRNVRVFESLGLNFNAWKVHFPAMLIATVVALALKFIGLITMVGIIFVFGFSNALIYSLYREIFKEEPKKSA